MEEITSPKPPEAMITNSLSLAPDDVFIVERADFGETLYLPWNSRVCEHLIPFTF